MTFTCPHCGCAATEVTVKGGQLSYRGCACIKFESLDGVLGLAPVSSPRQQPTETPSHEPNTLRSSAVAARAVAADGSRA